MTLVQAVAELRRIRGLCDRGLEKTRRSRKGRDSERAMACADWAHKIDALNFVIHKLEAEIPE